MLEPYLAWLPSARVAPKPFGHRELIYEVLRNRWVHWRHPNFTKGMIS